MEPLAKALRTERVFTIQEMSGVRTVFTISSSLTVEELKTAIANLRGFGAINYFRLLFQNTQLRKDMLVGDIEGNYLFLIFRQAGENH